MGIAHGDETIPSHLGWAAFALMYGLAPSVVGAILLSPPLRFSRPDHLGAWAADGKPLVALVPAFDAYLRPGEARERFAALPQADVIGVDGARHPWARDPAAGRPARPSWRVGRRGRGRGRSGLSRATSRRQQQVRARGPGLSAR